MENKINTKKLFLDKSIQERFKKLLGKKTQGFISSALQIVNNNKLLSKADPYTVLNAVVSAASYDLPISQNLGFAWIVPYKGQAQFQMGWKGYVQLALRTGQYKKINVVEVYENQFKFFNTLTEEIKADFTIEGEGEIIGYVAYFKLLNGFEKTCYWSKLKVNNHAKKYSQSYNYSHSPWQDKDQFDAMAKKTVLKNTLSKWGILSIEMQSAMLSDQSVQKNEGDYQYPDNKTIEVESQNIQEENNRIKTFIEKASTIEEVEEIKNSLDSEQLQLFNSEIEKKEILLINKDK